MCIYASIFYKIIFNYIEYDNEKNNIIKIILYYIILYYIMSDSITELNKLSSYDSATGNIPDQDGGHPIVAAIAAVIAAGALKLDPATRSSSSAVTNAGSAVLSTIRPAGTADGSRGTLDRFFDRNKNKNNIILTEQKQEQKNSKKDSNKDSKKDSKKENSYDLASAAAAAALAAAAAEKLRQTTQDVGTKITSFDTSVGTNTTSVGTNTQSVGTNTQSVGTNTQSDVPIFKSKLEKLKFLIDKHFEKIKELI